MYISIVLFVSFFAAILKVPQLTEENPEVLPIVITSFTLAPLIEAVTGNVSLNIYDPSDDIVNRSPGDTFVETAASEPKK